MEWLWNRRSSVLASTISYQRIFEPIVALIRLYGAALGSVADVAAFIIVLHIPFAAILVASYARFR